MADPTAHTRRPAPFRLRADRVAVAALAVAMFAAAVAAANALTARYGLIPVGLGLSATAGTYGRRGWVRAVIASNTVGAPVDTILFLALAGFPIWAAVPGQLLAKATATAIPVAVVLGVRALLRHRLRPTSA